jgi:hypothetical protein
MKTDAMRFAWACATLARQAAYLRTGCFPPVGRTGGWYACLSRNDHGKKLSYAGLEATAGPAVEAGTAVSGRSDGVEAVKEAVREDEQLTTRPASVERTEVGLRSGGICVNQGLS